MRTINFWNVILFGDYLYLFIFRDNREKIDPCEYTIENVTESTVIKKPGSINGQQFIVQNCQKSILCIFDYLDSATVDDCNDCTIFVGPTKGR